MAEHYHLSQHDKHLKTPICTLVNIWLVAPVEQAFTHASEQLRRSCDWCARVGVSIGSRRPKKVHVCARTFPNFHFQRVRVHLLAGCGDAVHADQHADPAGAYAAAPLRLLREARKAVGLSRPTQGGGSTTAARSCRLFVAAGLSLCTPPQNNSSGGFQRRAHNICAVFSRCLSGRPELKPRVAPLQHSGCARWLRQRLILDRLLGINTCRTCHRAANRRVVMRSL